MFRERIFSTPAKKLIVEMNGEELANYIVEMLPSINEGVPYIGDRVVGAVGKQVVDTARTMYFNGVLELTLPLPANELDNKLNALSTTSVEYFKNKMIGDNKSYTWEKYRRELMLLIQSISMTIYGRNNADGIEQCDTVVLQLVDNASSRAAHSKYETE